MDLLFRALAKVLVLLQGIQTILLHVQTDCGMNGMSKGVEFQHQNSKIFILPFKSIASYLYYHTSTLQVTRTILQSPPQWAQNDLSKWIFLRLYLATQSFRTDTERYILFFLTTYIIATI